ncbi:hypothetical protein J2X67_005546 [Variovorax sp. 3319]|nr:hypothetical protein [Variovorax sp. 3319]MDR6890998.1 hypothetical protein [Variovorax sp. 3319]
MIDAAEALLHGLDEHFAHRLARQPFALLCPIGQDLAAEAVLGKGRVTVCPESHLISKPSEHQRMSALSAWVPGRMDGVVQGLIFVFCVLVMRGGLAGAADRMTGSATHWLGARRTGTAQV